MEEGYWLYLFTTSRRSHASGPFQCVIYRGSESQFRKEGKARSVIKTGEWDVIYIFVEIALVHTNVKSGVFNAETLGGIDFACK